MSSRFLFNVSLWDELEKRAAVAKSVRAAVAYVGTGASRMLTLKQGDQLVTDMSLRSVRAGVTNPHEIKVMLENGVQVFSRASLHAKFFILGTTVIVGSSNISRHSKECLDEAAVLTNDPAAVARARAIFEQLCTEPVRNDYLQRCLEEYRPPTFVPNPARGPQRRREAVQGKLWLIANLEHKEIPDEELASAARAVAGAAGKILDFERSEVDYLHYSKRAGFFAKLREGDWAIQCFPEGRGYEVWPPARFLKITHYDRGRGKRRYLLLFEQPKNGSPIRWSALKARASAVKLLKRATPRTGPIGNDAEADVVLRLWDSRGRFRPPGR